MHAAPAFKLPPAGPRDQRVWLTLLALRECDVGGIEPDSGRVFVGDSAGRVKYEVDPADLDELAALGWVDDGRAVDELHLTDKGVYWLARFVRLNGGEWE
jgi:hypothetical protein